MFIQRLIIPTCCIFYVGMGHNKKVSVIMTVVAVYWLISSICFRFLNSLLRLNFN